MKAQPGGKRGSSDGRIKMPKGSAAGDIMGAPWYETPQYKEPDHPGGGEYDWSKEKEGWGHEVKEIRVDDNTPKKARYGYRGTDNPKRATHTKKLTTYDKKKPATKKKPKKKKPVVRMPIPEYRRPTPKTKKRIKGVLRDNLPIFGVPGQVPEG